MQNHACFLDSLDFAFSHGSCFPTGVTPPYWCSVFAELRDQEYCRSVSVKKVVSPCLLLVFGFGMFFEPPLAIMLLSHIKLAGDAMPSCWRHYAILSNGVVAALLTPAPDVVNKALIAQGLHNTALFAEEW